MPKLMIFDRDENYIGRVKDLIFAKHSIELNGEDYIEFETLSSNIMKGYRILYQDLDINEFYEFIVQEVDEYKQGNQVISRIYAENSISETICDFIEDRRFINKTSKEIIEAVFEYSRWEVGKIDSPISKATTNFYRTNVMSAIDTIKTLFFYELETKVTLDEVSNKIDRRINFLLERGAYRGLRLTYTNNLMEIKRKTLLREVVTALYGFGKGEELPNGNYGRKIDFSSINNGKKYVEDEVAKKVWGRINSKGERIHNYGKVEFDNITDRQVLLELTKDELSKLSKPAVSYEATVIDLFKVSKGDGVSKTLKKVLKLGDTVKILDRDFTPAINYNTRVLRIEKDLLQLEATRITLGELIKSLQDKQDEQDKILEEIQQDNELKDWGDDGGGGDGDPGELPTYEKVEDMVKKYPSLKIGLSSWIDVNEEDAVRLTASGKVMEVMDVLTKKPVYNQSIPSLAPTLKNRDGRRWLSFNPDPMTLNTWQVEKGSEPLDGYPKNSIKQNGQLINYMKSEDELKTIVVVYHDRTPDILDGVEWTKAKATDVFRIGRSSPLGYPFGVDPALPYSYNYNRNPGKDIMIQRAFHSYNYGFGPRSYNVFMRGRDEFLFSIVEPSQVDLNETFNLNNIGMNKQEYTDILYKFFTGDNKKASYVEYNGFYTGEISEIIAYFRKLDNEEKAIIEEYLSSKYNASNNKAKRITHDFRG